MGLIEKWKQQRRDAERERRRARARAEFQLALEESIAAGLHAMMFEPIPQPEPEAEPSLADKVLAGDAVVLGVNPTTGTTLVAEKRDEPTEIPGSDELRRYEAHVRSEEWWAAENQRMDMLHRALRSQWAADEAPMPRQTAGVTIVRCGMRPRFGFGTSSDRCEHPAGHDGPHAVTVERPESSRPARTFEWFDPPICSAPVEDDGPMPPQEEIDAVLRAGMSDDVDLVGTQVWYETDRRGGRSYALPAWITCVQKSHVDLPALRALEERGLFKDGSMDPTVPSRSYLSPEAIDEGWATTREGVRVPGNALPIPHGGTVHLAVLTPGERCWYHEWSVPYDAQRTARTWRHRDAHHPF